jgi:hypothetical protein
LEHRLSQTHYGHLRQQGRNIPDNLLMHFSPLSWEQINLTGIYSWDVEQQIPESFRPLRLPGRRLLFTIHSNLTHDFEQCLF